MANTASSQPSGQPSDQAPLGRIAAAIRRERSRAGLSLSDLARRAGMAKSTLSQLEAGNGNPSLETMWALSVALAVPFAQLLDPPQRPVQVIRAGEGETIAATGAAYAATLLSAGPMTARRDIYRVTAGPGHPRLSPPHQPGTVEHVLLATGQALVGPADAPVELGPGDFISYPGDEEHIFDALLAGTSAMLVSEQR